MGEYGSTHYGRVAENTYVFGYRFVERVGPSCGRVANGRLMLGSEVEMARYGMGRSAKGV